VRAALWLAARELSVRKRRAAIAAAVVAAATALVAATEVLARAREEAIARDLDAMGPSIRIVPFGALPAGPTAEDPGRETLADGVADIAARALGRDLRRLEGRLTLPRDRDRPAVIGVAPDAIGLATGDAAAGAVLAERIGVGASVVVAGRNFRVARALPPGATAEDLALFLRLDDVQAAVGSNGVNELRIHLAPGAHPGEAVQRLRAAAIPGRVVPIARGEVAERDAHESLARHRVALYAFTGVVAAIALLVAAHLDASERRTELATLVAVGASPGSVVSMAVARSLLVAAAGALSGSVIGMVVPAIRDPAAAAGAVRALPALLAAVAAAMGLGVAAAIPSAVLSARRDPVADLQDASA
jgi:hypothetical protein